MFEIDISKAAREGVMLHKQDGTPYWKLIMTCNREGCEKEVDMGECLCFDKEDEMVRCRDTHGMHCSTKCWYEDHSREEIKKELERFKKEIKMMDLYDRPHPDWSNELECLEEWFDMLSEFYDGADFYELYDIEECPI